MDQQPDVCSCICCTGVADCICHRQLITRLCEVFLISPPPPGYGKEIVYSCLTERKRVTLTQLIDRFTHIHHLVVWLHPLRCKERQMWYLASYQCVSFFFLLKVRIRDLRKESTPVSKNTTIAIEETIWKLFFFFLSMLTKRTVTFFPLGFYNLCRVKNIIFPIM